MKREGKWKLQRKEGEIEKNMGYAFNNQNELNLDGSWTNRMNARFNVFNSFNHCTEGRKRKRTGKVKRTWKSKVIWKGKDTKEPFKSLDSIKSIKFIRLRSFGSLGPYKFPFLFALSCSLSPGFSVSKKSVNRWNQSNRLFIQVLSFNGCWKARS